MLRVFKYPELLFIALVLVAPLFVALLWRSGTVSFSFRLLLGAAAGFVIWLAIIVLVVWPRYRND